MFTHVKTRNGLFSNEGYGGGLFNGNVAFGSYDTPTGVQGLGVDNTASSYPWMQYSLATHALQTEVNQMLASPVYPNNPCPIDVDGFMGPELCGALAWLGEDDRLGGGVCLQHKGQYRSVHMPSATNPCPAKFADYRQGDPCSAKHTIQNVQRYLGRTTDGKWGPLSQASMDTITRADGTTYCDLVPGCTGPLPTGVTCPTADGPQPPIVAPPVVVAPAPMPPIIDSEPEPEEEPEVKESSMGMLMVGGLLLAVGIAAVVMKKK